jgi:thiamine pyrophosphate-dependent acetolactate synthase large subunit-like protein
MTLQELDTFQQSKRPGDRLIVIVLDDRLLGRVIFVFDGAKGCNLLGPDFCELANAYGGHGHRLNDAVEIGNHVRDAKVKGLSIRIQWDFPSKHSGPKRLVSA